MKCENILISNKLGLHARASAKFVKIASKFDCDITLALNGQCVNGKSIMGIMMLAAAQGKKLELCAEGRDEQEAMKKLSALIHDGFGEDV